MLIEEKLESPETPKVKINKIYEKFEVAMPPPSKSLGILKQEPRAFPCCLLQIRRLVSGQGRRGEDPRRDHVTSQEREGRVLGLQPQHRLSAGHGVVAVPRSSLCLLPDEENDIYMLCYLRNSKIL